MNVLGTSSEQVGALAARYSRAWSPSWRFLLDEAVGSLGDLGTFLPIVIGLVQFARFDAATILVFAGLMNIFSGSIFRIPLAVQPMKAIAALAIAGALTAGQAHVAVLKHDAYGLDVDRPGKDSDRFFRAGVDVRLVGPGEELLRVCRPSGSRTRRQVAAVDRQNSPGNEGCLVGGQEGHSGEAEK